MNKDSFKNLFERSLEVAALNAEAKLGRSVPHAFMIELHDAGHSGILLTPDQTFELLFLGEDIFYRIIDIAATTVFRSYTRVFVRISNHAPSTFDKTWNQPPGTGPFKQILAEELCIKEH